MWRGSRFGANQAYKPISYLTIMGDHNNDNHNNDVKQSNTKWQESLCGKHKEDCLSSVYCIIVIISWPVPCKFICCGPLKYRQSSRPAEWTHRDIPDSDWWNTHNTTPQLNDKRTHHYHSTTITTSSGGRITLVIPGNVLPHGRAGEKDSTQDMVGCVSTLGYLASWSWIVPMHIFRITTTLLKIRMMMMIVIIITILIIGKKSLFSVWLPKFPNEAHMTCNPSLFLFFGSIYPWQDISVVAMLRHIHTIRIRW